MRTAMVLLLACGLFRTPSVGAQEGKGKRCSVDSVAGAFQAGGPVRRDCEVERPARLHRDVRPSYTLPATQSCATAVLEFVVGTAGRPETATARVVRTDTPGYAALLLSRLAEWQYEPARDSGMAVRQVIQERRTFLNHDRLVFVTGRTPRHGVAPPPAQCAP